MMVSQTRGTPESFMFSGFSMKSSMGDTQYPYLGHPPSGIQHDYGYFESNILGSSWAFTRTKIFRQAGKSASGGLELGKIIFDCPR